MAKKILILLAVAVLLTSLALAAAILLTPYLQRSSQVASAELATLAAATLVPDLPSPTSTTAAPTATPVEGIAFAATRTDAEGKTNVQDPFLHAPLVIQVVDADTGKPLPGITTYFAGKGADLLIVAVDSQHHYLTALRQVTHQKVGGIPLTSLNEQAAYPASSSADVFVAMHPVAAASTSAGWLTLGAELPNVDHFLTAQDYCINPNQIITGTHTAVGGPVSTLPAAAPQDSAQPAALVDWSWLALRSEMMGSLDGEPAQSKLAALLAAGGGVVHMKVYALDRNARGDKLALLAGWCVEPLDHSSPDSIMKWIEYATSQGDPYALAQLTADPPFDVVQYGPYRAEYEGAMNRETLAREIGASGLKGARCLGYAIYRTGGKIELFEIFTSNWSIGWDTSQARGIPYAAFSFLPTKRSVGALETTAGLYLNYMGIPQPGDVPKGLAACPDLLAPASGSTTQTPTPAR